MHEVEEGIRALVKELEDRAMDAECRVVAGQSAKPTELAEAIDQEQANRVEEEGAKLCNKQRHSTVHSCDIVLFIVGHMSIGAP